MKQNFPEFIIDGYNLMYKLLPNKPKRSLQEMREQLEARLLNVQQSSRHKVTVIYDGQHPQRPIRNTGSLESVFTASGYSADEWIVDHLKSLGKNAGMFTVVSSDRFISSHAKAWGAAAMSSDDFIETYLSGAEKPTAGRYPVKNPEKYHSRQLSEREVNHWLTLFGETGE